MSRVFISYRRDDTGAEAGRLAADLEYALGEGTVFLDVDGLGPGVRFGREIKAALTASEVVLVMIGPDWSPDRLAADDDWVRQEIELAFESDIAVLPIRVRGGQVPAGAALPESIRDLAGLNAPDVENHSWKRDVAPIIAHVRDTLGLRQRSVGAVDVPEQLVGGLVFDATMWMAWQTQQARLIHVMDGCRRLLAKAHGVLRRHRGDPLVRRIEAHYPSDIDRYLSDGAEHISGRYPSFFDLVGRLEDELGHVVYSIMKDGENRIGDQYISSFRRMVRHADGRYREALDDDPDLSGLAELVQSDRIDDLRAAQLGFGSGAQMIELVYPTKLSIHDGIDDVEMMLYRDVLERGDVNIFELIEDGYGRGVLNKAATIIADEGWGVVRDAGHVELNRVGRRMLERRLATPSELFR